MKATIKIGLIRETKTPPDRRVAMTPEQAAGIKKTFPDIEILVQSSPIRCYTDEEYSRAGLPVRDDVSECDILIGIKEVKMDYLIQGKTYFFFSHTTKKQPYNRALLQNILKKNITLIDYEQITDKNHIRLIAFGKWAGIVGAYNGLIAYGKKYGSYDLKPAHKCFDREEMIRELSNVKLPPVKILITGKGRVGQGAMETLAPLKYQKVSAPEFLNKQFKEPVLCQIDADEYVKHKAGKPFDFGHFFKHPEEYESIFQPFTRVTDIYIACHFWNPRSPVFISADDMKATDFHIKAIADISCDIKDPIASTLRPSTISDPFYGYDPATGKETDAFSPKSITVMAVDNLPGELPRDSSQDFGKTLTEKIFPSLLGQDNDQIIERATISKNGELTNPYQYLSDWAAGKE